MKKWLKLVLILCLSSNIAFAYDTNMSPEIIRSYGKQQQKAQDTKENTILVTPNYESYADRNQNTSEKIVAIYDKRSPAYGYRYVLYTPVGHYVGHHKILQQSPNGYGFSPVPDGGEDSKTPCFRTINEAKHYYYPEWY